MPDTLHDRNLTNNRLSENDADTTENRQRALNAINEELSAEIGVLTAIYDKPVLVVLDDSSANSVSCLLHIPGTDCSFKLTFPPAYPDECPQLAGLSELQRSTSSVVQRLHTQLLKALSKLFVVGRVCMFDVIESVNDDLQLQARALRPELNSFHNESRSADLDRPTETVHQHSQVQLVDTEVLQSWHTCTICLDNVPLVDLVKLPCNHYFCTDCLNSKSMPVPQTSLLNTTLFYQIPSHTPSTHTNDSDHTHLQPASTTPSPPKHPSSAATPPAPSPSPS